MSMTTSRRLLLSAENRVEQGQFFKKNEIFLLTVASCGKS